jgi:transposase-like protein
LAVCFRIPTGLTPPGMKQKKSRTDTRWGTSLRCFPWEKKTEDPTEDLIQTNESEHYEAKHPKTSEKETALVNSIRPVSCPYCGSSILSKAGKREDGIQMYRCIRCKRRFTPLTGTIFDSHKIPMSEWIEYLRFLMEFHSVRTSARDNKNAVTTGFYWLGKIFLVLRGIQDPVVLKGRVFLDETFFPVVKSQMVRKDGKRL